MMRIHKVRSPFMSRAGQFEEGKQTLVIGLDLHALLTTDVFRCYLGTNEKCYYEIDAKEALRLAEQHNSIWTNPEGKKVCIVPIKDFQRINAETKQVEEVSQKYTIYNHPDCWSKEEAHLYNEIYPNGHPKGMTLNEAKVQVQQMLSGKNVVFDADSLLS